MKPVPSRLTMSTAHDISTQAARIIRFMTKVKGVRMILMMFWFPVAMSSRALPPLLSVKEMTNHPPKVIRTCCLFGAKVKFAGIPLLNKTDIISPDQLGNHTFMGGGTEDNGIIYTRNGGFEDTGHMRDCADWTGYLFSYINEAQAGNLSKVLDLGKEGGEKLLALHLQTELTREKTAELAGAIAYDLSLWHEIATWFGASYVPLVPEGYSSFSPEDLYSNLLGTQLGIKAILSDLPFEEAMDLYTAQILDELGAFGTIAETEAAMRKTESLWWSAQKRLPGKQLLIKRYFDSNEGLRPWLVPGYETTEAPAVLTKPSEQLDAHFSLSIRLNYKFPVKSLQTTAEGRQITQRDFPAMVRWIEQDAMTLANQAEQREKPKRERAEKAQERKADKEKKS